MEHLFIYPVLLFVTYLLYKVLKMKAGRNWLRKGGALPPMQTDMRKSVRDTTYMETVFPAEFKEHPDDADFFPDFAKMDIPENLGETLIEALSNNGIPEPDAIETSVEETTGLQAGPVFETIQARRRYGKQRFIERHGKCECLQRNVPDPENDRSQETNLY